MKIAIDCRQLENSGVGTFLKNILSELFVHHEENEYLLICGSVVPKGVEGKANVRIQHTGIKALSAIELLSFPCKEINKCDVFFTPYINIPRGIKIPVFSTIHDVIFMDMPELTSRLGYMARKLYLTRTVNNSTSIFTVSEFTKERIVDHFHTKKPITVIYNAVSDKISQYTQEAQPSKDYYLFVGNIKRHKGLSTLLQAYAEAKRRGLKESLVIVGNADRFRTSDTEFTKLLSETKDVKFTGYVSDNELSMLVYNAKALVQPSLYEGFGLPPIEAMYLGTKAIVSDIPVFKELYSDMPVTFFRCGDSRNLASNLLSCDGKIDREKVKDIIYYKFNIRSEVGILLEAIKQINKKFVK